MSADVDPYVVANRDYYNNMPTRRYRVVVDVDVEYREDEPRYAEGVIATDLAPAIVAYGVRFAAADVQSVEPYQPPALLGYFVAMEPESGGT